MPFYDYKCAACGRKFEVSHGMSGKPDGLRCESCGSPDLHRIFQPVGVMKAGGALPAGGSSSCSSCASGACGSCH